MKALLVRLEPVIWLLFGAGMMVGAFLLPAFILVVGLAGPLGWTGAEALSYQRMHGLASHPVGRLVLLAAIALPLWVGAHQLRHVWIDLGGLKTDGLVGSLLYGTALAAGLLGVVAVTQL